MFRLGDAANSGQSELFGINVFKVREILVMPTVTTVVGAEASILGMADIRGQVIPVIDLPRLLECQAEVRPEHHAGDRVRALHAGVLPWKPWKRSCAWTGAR